MRPPMTRPRRKLPPIVTRRETLHLLLLLAALVLVLEAMGRLKRPGAMDWFFGNDQLVAELDVDNPPPADVRFARIENVGPVDAPPNVIAAGAPVLAAAQKDVPGEKNDGVDPSDKQLEKAFNPLRLVQTSELHEVNQAYLSDVKDETFPSRTDPTRRARISADQLPQVRRNSNDALYQLLGVAATTPPEQFANEARKDLFVSNLWKDPSKYRGKVVHIEGVLHRLEINAEDLDEKNPYAIGKIYEAWVFLDEVNTHVRVLFTDLPEGMPLGLKLKENISFDAFFFKLYAYQGQDDKWRGVPMLLGFRPEWVDIDTSAANRQAQIFSIVVGVLFFGGLLALWWISRRDRNEAASLRQSTAPKSKEDVSFLTETPSDEDAGGIGSRDEGIGTRE